MNPLTRERVAWLAATLMIGTLAFQLNGTLAHRDDDYAFVRTLVDIHRQVARNYVDGVDEDKLRQGAIDGMLAQLDPYSNYVPPSKQEEFDRHLEGTFKGIGVQLDQAENGDIRVISPIEGSPAFKAGVLAGDIILKVNGEELKGLKVDQVQDKIKKGPLEVRMRVRHDAGDEVDLPPMTRQEIVLSTVKGYKRNADASWNWFVSGGEPNSADPKIGYLRLTQFTPDTFDRMKPAMDQMLAAGMKAFVLDLRFNPGGRLDQAEKVVDLFVEEGVIVVTKGRNRPQQVAKAEREGTLPDFPMIVLVNEHSASASEVVAGSLQDNKRALVLGERSYGKGSVQEVMGLDNREGELKLTVAYYYLPSGRLVHKKPGATDWGVEPQIKIPMTMDQERRLVIAQADAEIIGRPPARLATTLPAGATR
ncbi:MAG: ctpA, partial [Phycisphaerales bacterium]|nr:ctpA [Phycisphaerales bacterium]